VGYKRRNTNGCAKLLHSLAANGISDTENAPLMVEVLATSVYAGLALPLFSFLAHDKPPAF
jgi:hypothetical protein